MKVICINSQGKPDNISFNEWIQEGAVYTVALNHFVSAKEVFYAANGSRNIWYGCRNSVGHCRVQISLSIRRTGRDGKCHADEQRAFETGFALKPELTP